MLVKGICEWCHLGDSLDALLSGRVDLSALRSLLLESDRPDSITIWLYSKPVKALLESLASGDCELSHQGLDRVDSRRMADHVRGLLVACGLLVKRNDALAKFDLWVQSSFPDSPTPEDDLLLRKFTRWKQRPDLESPNASTNAHYARQQELRVGAKFLFHVHERGERLDCLSQATVDEWWATPPTTARQARRFLKWAIESQNAPRSTKIPKLSVKGQPKLDQRERIRLLAKMTDPKFGPLNARAAGILVLLLGQPFPKIAGLRRNDLDLGDPTTLMLGRDPVEIPEPFASVLREQVLSTVGRRTAANQNSEWLFVGGMPGEHVSPNFLRTRVRDLGVDLRGAKTTAIETLVADCPPSIVAEMLDYSYNTIERHASNAGVVWSRYAALVSD